MKDYHAADIRNIAIAGHSGSGKTTLAEALIYKAGASDRLGKTAEGTTVCDYDPEEIKRKASLGASIASFEYNGLKLNLLDAPGLFDFEGDMLEAVRASDTVMITVSGKSGVKVGTEKAYAAAQKMNKASMFVITKVDDPDANFYNVLTDLKTVFGPTVCPVIVPVIKDRQVVSYINLIEMKCYKYDDKGNVSETDMPTAEISEKIDYRLDGLVAAFSEAVAETDDALMEKFFEGEAFTQKELHIIRGTAMAEEYLRGEFAALTLEEYVDIICAQLELLPSELIIQRVTGDGARDTLIAPLWSLKKFVVMNEIDKKLARDDTMQGSKYCGK